MPSIDYLLSNSGLPGPRGNLELLYSFAKQATEDEVQACFSFYADDLHDSPEEFVVMCGIVGYCIINRNQLAATLETIRKYASHSSWRVREAVAIGIQEIAENRFGEIISILKPWMDGNDLEQRAIIAALCEPKLLKEKTAIIQLFELLTQITLRFQQVQGKLSDNQNSLRKTLGYGWSVAIVSLPDEGRAYFERIAQSGNKHIQWIVKENLKKKRLLVMDPGWVAKLSASV